MLKHRRVNGRPHGETRGAQDAGSARPEETTAIPDEVADEHQVMIAHGKIPTGKSPIEP